jgi:hypothetical protein
LRNDQVCQKSRISKVCLFTIVLVNRKKPNLNVILNPPVSLGKSRVLFLTFKFFKKSVWKLVYLFFFSLQSQNTQNKKNFEFPFATSTKRKGWKLAFVFFSIKKILRVVCYDLVYHLNLTYIKNISFCKLGRLNTDKYLTFNQINFIFNKYIKLLTVLIIRVLSRLALSSTYP